MMSQDSTFTIADICYSAHVTRWHSKNCHRYPSIAEHAFLVTMMTSRLYHLIEVEPIPEEELALLKMAMWHDMPEVITGDLPTPIKRWMERYYPKGENPLDALEEALCPEFKAARVAMERLGPHLFLVFKMADVAEAYRFIKTEAKGSEGKSIARERMQTLLKMRHTLDGIMHDRYLARYSDMGQPERGRHMEKALDRLSSGMSQFFEELESEEIKQLDFTDEIQRIGEK